MLQELQELSGENAYTGPGSFEGKEVTPRRRKSQKKSQGWWNDHDT